MPMSGPYYGRKVDPGAHPIATDNTDLLRLDDFLDYPISVPPSSSQEAS